MVRLDAEGAAMDRVKSSIELATAILTGLMLFVLGRRNCWI